MKFLKFENEIQNMKGKNKKKEEFSEMLADFL